MSEKNPSPQTGRALRLRRRVKGKKPRFVRPESWRYVRLKEGWRHPRGLDNKVRKSFKGWPPLVSIGFRGPRVARGLHPSGYKEILVYNAERLKDIDPKTEAIRISHTVGKRKRAGIIAEARKRKIAILNFRQVKETAPEEEAKEEEKSKETEPEKKEGTDEIAEEKESAKEKKTKRQRRRRKE